MTVFVDPEGAAQTEEAAFSLVSFFRRQLC